MDGYVFDFGVLKPIIRNACKKLNGKTILPELCPNLNLESMNDGHIKV